MLTTEQKKDILRWAQTTIDSISEQELGDDWWGAYDKDWDINIWWDLFCFYATAYPYKDGTLDTENFITCGSLMPAWKMIDASCDICGDEMGRTKYDGDQPVRLTDGDGDEFAHLRCCPLPKEI